VLLSVGLDSCPLTIKGIFLTLRGNSEILCRKRMLHLPFLSVFEFAFLKYDRRVSLEETHCASLLSAFR
jgi:hypothetical protein